MHVMKGKSPSQYVEIFIFFRPNVYYEKKIILSLCRLFPPLIWQFWLRQLRNFHKKNFSLKMLLQTRRMQFELHQIFQKSRKNYKLFIEKLIVNKNY